MSSHLITTPADLATACAEISKFSWIAVDTEFIRERTYYPILALIQIGTSESVYLIDPTALQDIRPLLDLMTNPQIRKVMHAAQADQECLWCHYQCLATPLFDTSIAASLLGIGEQVSLARLTEHVLGIHLPKGNSRTQWLTRPLPDELRQYAEADVANLVKIGQTLAAQLEERGRTPMAEAFFAEWTKPERYTPNFLTIAERLGSKKKLSESAFARLVELAKWREEIAQKVNIPKRRVADDQALLDIAITAPKTRDHLQSFRGIAPQFFQPERILEICQTSAKYPRQGHKPSPSLDPREKLSVDLFYLLIRHLAIEHHISARHLVGPDSAEAMLMGQFTTSNDWVAAGLLPTETHALIGDTLWAFVCGKLTIGLQNGQFKLLTPS